MVCSSNSNFCKDLFFIFSRQSDIHEQMLKFFRVISFTNLRGIKIFSNIRINKETKNDYYFSYFRILITSYFILISKTVMYWITCRHFIINTYLYLLISLILCLFIMALDNTPELNPYHSRLLVGKGIASFIIMFIVIIFVLVVAMKIPSTNILGKHLSWLLLVFLLSIVFYPSYYLSRETNLFYSTLITVAAMMSILTIFAFWKPEWISLHGDQYYW